MDRAQLRYLLNSGPSRVLDVRKLQMEGQLAPLFKIQRLNSCILLKQTNTESTDEFSAIPPIATLIFIPYDRRKPEDGGESFVFTPANMGVAARTQLGDQKVKQDDIAADTELFSMFDRVPSFSPYLLQDVIERASLSVPPGYFIVPEREAAMVKQRMRARLRPVVANAFGNQRSAVSENSIERLVQKLWELQDLDSLAPLIQAFKIAPEHAQEVFYCWLGIAFFENEYIKLQPKLKKFAAWIGTKAAPREALPRDLLEHFQHSVDLVRKRLQSNWKQSLEILGEYTETYQELIGSSGSPQGFVEYLKRSKSHFWTLGGCLGRLEQSVEVWDQIAGRFNHQALGYEVAIELFKTLNLINATAPLGVGQTAAA